MDAYCTDRLYMPRRTKRVIRALMWLMFAGFAAGLFLLSQDGTLQQGLHDWQTATTSIFNSAK